MKALFLFFIVLSTVCTAQIPPLINGNLYSVVITPPTFIQEAETAWNSTATPKTTASFNVTAGDILVAYSISESSGSTIAVSNTAGAALTWTSRQALTPTNFTQVWIWTAAATTTNAMTVTFTKTGSAHFFGGNVLTFRGSAGVGASTSANLATTAPSMALVTTADNSTIVVVNGDWAEVDGTTRTWRTVNSITPTSGNGLEVTYFRDAAHYVTYAAYYNNAGTAGSKTVGLSAPTGQTSSMCAIEIKGQ